MEPELNQKEIQQADILADGLRGNELMRQYKARWFKEGVQVAAAHQSPSVLWNDVQMAGYRTQKLVMSVAAAVKA